MTLQVLLLSCLALLFLTVRADWNCPTGSQFCFQWIEDTLTWSRARAKCVEMGAELPGAEHLNQIRNLKQGRSTPYWISLCFNDGRLQWLGSNPYEESDLSFIDKLLPDLVSSRVVSGKGYCFVANGNLFDRQKAFGLAPKDSQQALNGVCVGDRRLVHQPTVPWQWGRISSVEVKSLGADLDWGPVGQKRDGFMNIFGLKHRTLRLKCDARTSDPQLVMSYRWLRNGAYIGNNSQEIDFPREEDLIPWIGAISCEAVLAGQEVGKLGEGFHLVMWNTVTLRLTSSCTSCGVQGIMEATKIILTQFVEIEISPGLGRELEFYNEPPIIQRSGLSLTLHLRNKRVDKFDFKMVRRLGARFQLSAWAKQRSLILPNGSDLQLESISPCNMALPQDRGNITWIGYLGQTVPSNNIIGGPICVDGDGAMITRSCGLSSSSPNRYQECASMKPRREEPACFPGFEPADGKCFRMTEPLEYSDAVAQCWAGWQMQSQMMVHESLSNWVQDSANWIARTKTNGAASSLVWLPLKRPNKAALLHTPIWSWTSVNNQWLPHSSIWNVTGEGVDDEQCAAYHLDKGQIVSQSCQSQLPMICSRPSLPQPISSLIEAQPNRGIGEFFCPPGWITHWLVLDEGLCYRRFVLKVAVDWDGAQLHCARHGGHLAVAPTHTMRVALEQVYAHFNNRSVVDSWIGLRSRIPGGPFRWINQTTKHSQTYNWQPYNEFGEGYGVSTGLSRMWWNWPREVKLWGLLCQKNVTDWKGDLRLRLEPPADSAREGDYALAFTYNPKPIPVGQNLQAGAYEAVSLPQQRQMTYAKKYFWQPEVNVLCFFGDYVRRFTIPIGSQRTYRGLVSVPTAMGPGALTCEAWLNRPAYRFQSNTVVHRPLNSFTFVFHVALNSPNPQHRNRPHLSREALADDFVQRLSPNRAKFLRDIMSDVSIIGSFLPDSVMVRYRLSFFLPAHIQRSDLLAGVLRCNAETVIELYADADAESLLHLLLTHCLPLAYGRNEPAQLVDVRSTVACPADFASGVFVDDVRSTDQLSWPRTAIGETARSMQLCLSSSSQLIHRSCVGSFAQGAIWGPLKVARPIDNLGPRTACRTPPTSVLRLFQLERMAKTVADGSSATNILTDLLSQWDENNYLSLADIEMSVSVLRQLISASNRVRVSRSLVATVLERIVRPSKCPLWEMQLYPKLLANFMQLLSDLPVVDLRGPRARVNIGEKLSIVAEGIDFGDQRNAQQPLPSIINFDRMVVNISRDSRNFANKQSLLTVASVLPAELLTIDPLTKRNEVKVFQPDSADPTNAAHLLGHYTAEETVIRIDLKTSPPTTFLPSPLTLAFKDVEPIDVQPASDDRDVLCTRWDSNRAAWMTGSCWYLGFHSNVHFCQCHQPGTYALMRSAPDRMAAVVRLLPATVPIVSILIVLFCMLIRAVCIYRRVVHEMDFIELGARLQLVLAWAGVLLCHLAAQHLVDGHTADCIATTTSFQYFLTVALMWLFTLHLIRHWQIHDRWIDHQKRFLAKLSLAVWGLSSLLVVTIPIYKLQYLQLFEDFSECWLEDPVDFGLTVAIVTVGSCSSLVLHMKNTCDQSALSDVSFGVSGCLSLLSTSLMSATAIMAALSNSWYFSIEVAVALACSSSVLSVLWLYIFLTALPSPLSKHDFRKTNNRTMRHDRQNKTVYGSSIEYLADQ